MVKKEELFKRYEHDEIEIRGGGYEPSYESITVEDLYQAFKERLLEEMKREGE